MLSFIATLLPHTFQNIAMYFSLENRQLQQQLTFKIRRNCVPGLLTVQDDTTIIFTI